MLYCRLENYVLTSFINYNYRLIVWTSLIAFTRYLFSTNNFLLQVKKVIKNADSTLDIEVETTEPGNEAKKEIIQNVNCLLWAIGRNSATNNIGLEKIVS